MMFVECKPDYTLASKLTLASRTRFEHSANKSAVLNKLVRRKGSQNYENSLGMIDEDPRANQPRSIRDFAEVRNLPDHKIRLLYYKWLNNHVLVLCPRLEEWIIEAACEAGINMVDYGLPSEPEVLHQVINLNIEKFELLIDALKMKSSRVNGLKQCIEEVLSKHPAC